MNLIECNQCARYECLIYDRIPEIPITNTCPCLNCHIALVCITMCDTRLAYTRIVSQQWLMNEMKKEENAKPNRM